MRERFGGIGRALCGAAALWVVVAGGPALGGDKLQRLPVEELRVQKPDSGECVTLKFREATIEQKHGGGPHACACRAVLFRVLQIVAAEREGSLLKIAQLKQVRSGWPSEANREVLCDVLGLPQAKFKHASDPPKCDKEVVPTAWWQFTFVDGKSVTVWATPKALPAEFIEMHDQHKRGDKSEAMRKAIGEKKEQLAKTLSTTILNELFVVIE